jgi:diguanylate cyclase
MLHSITNRAAVYVQLTLTAAIIIIVLGELIFSPEAILPGRIAVLLLCALTILTQISSTGSAVKEAHATEYSGRPTSFSVPQLTPIIDALSKSISDHLAAIISHSDSMVSASERLDQDGTAANVNTVIMQLLAENRIMKAASEQANSELRAKSIEIKLLRNDLEATKHIADTDPLTQVSNRRHIMDALEAKANSNTTPAFCLALLDIDNFKSINDSYGHQVGDIVLKTYAYEISRLLRGRDLVARFGGEEFLILLNNISLHSAVAVIERIHNSLTGIDWSAVEGLDSVRSVTSSIGVAEWSPLQSIEQLIGRTDSLLYKAKKEGRNRIIWR